MRIDYFILAKIFFKLLHLFTQKYNVYESLDPIGQSFTSHWESSTFNKYAFKAIYIF